MNFELFETADFAFSVFEGLEFGSLYASSVPGKKMFGSDFKKRAIRSAMSYAGRTSSSCAAADIRYPPDRNI